MKHVWLTVAIALLFFGCQHKPTKKSTVISKPAQKAAPPTVVKSAIIRHGDTSAQKPRAGNTVAIHYTCWLADEHNKRTRRINSSLDTGKPLTFIVGVNQIIKGIDSGIRIMHVGEQRSFIIPPHLAYGAIGHGTIIPPQATLIFDIHLLAVT